MIPLLRFWDVSVSLICKLHIWRSIRSNDISENVIYLFYYKTKSRQNVHVWCRGRNTRTWLLRSDNFFLCVCPLGVNFRTSGSVSMWDYCEASVFWRWENTLPPCQSQKNIRKRIKVRRWLEPMTFWSLVRRCNHWAIRTQMAERRLYIDVPVGCIWKWVVF